MRYSVITFSIILLLGCVPYSDNTITDPSKGKLDSTIFGTWFWREKNESGFIHIGIDEEPKLLRLMMIVFGRDGKVTASEFSGHTSSLEGNNYLNLKSRSSAEAETIGYMFVKYKVSQDSLGIALMGYEVAKNAIKDGTLKGQVKEGNLTSSVLITEGQKKLQEFILRKDKELFPEMIYLQKLQLPNPSLQPTRNPHG